MTASPLRRCVITLHWHGADKPVREFIEERLDALFEDLTYTGKILSAWSTVEWTSRVKEGR